MNDKVRAAAMALAALNPIELAAIMEDTVGVMRANPEAWAAFMRGDEEPMRQAVATWCKAHP